MCCNWKRKTSIVVMCGGLLGMVWFSSTGMHGAEVTGKGSNANAQQTPQEVQKDLPAPPQEVQEALLRLHNEARGRRGLAPLQPHPRLMAAAQRFAEYMQRTHRFSHYGDGRSPSDRIAAEGYRHGSWAENIAWSQQTPEQAMNTWMNSGGHRGNILSSHKQVGFGQVGTIWVTVFADPVQDAS